MGHRIKLMSIEMFLVVMTIIAVNVASGGALERRKRHVISGSEGTSQGRPSSRSLHHSSPNSLGFEENEDSGRETTEKKVAHRLVGGHMRLGTTTTTTTMKSVSALRRATNDSRESSEKHEEETDEATWDDGLVISSAGNGKEKKTRPDENDDDDEKKSLSQQVKEGKYGLIQNEIYPTRAKRPGIISYLSNPEVPRDNAKNLGGLDEEEIWLAENHVLVLRGGNFPDHGKEPHPISSNSDDWSPIDDYKAPKRQVKIPSRPEVPPPFPVQLEENGPVQILSTNGTGCSGTCPEDETSNGGSADKDKDKSEDGVVSKDPTSRETKTGDKDQDGKIKSGHVPPRNGGVIGPFFPSLPPGAVFVVPPSNQSDYDEDDQSIYYPAPYSFYYNKQENSTPVPPGPLVPGIILPPPPDFFSKLEVEKNLSTTKQPHRTKYTKRPPPTTTDASPSLGADPTYYPARKSVPKTYKGTTSRGSSSSSRGGKPSSTKYTGSRESSITMKPLSGMKYKSTTGRSSSKKPIREPETVEMTTKPYVNTKSTTSLELTEFYTARPNTLTNSEAEETTAKSKSRWIASVSSKPVPLVITYYSSSTPSTIDRPVEVEATPPPGRERNRGGSTPHQASYYFYEETNEEDTTVATTPSPKVHYRATTETPAAAFYRLRQQQIDHQPQRVKVEETGESYLDHQLGRGQTETPETLDMVETLKQPLEETTLRYRSANFRVPTTNSAEPTTRLKSQRMLAEVSPPYYDQMDVRARPHLQNLRHSQSLYATTPRTTSLSSAKPKAIYQYSYESADYSKRRQEDKREDYASDNSSSDYYDEEKITSEQVASTPEPFDEWRDVRVDSQPEYEYEEGGDKSSPEQEIRSVIANNRYGNAAGRVKDTTANPNLAYYTKQDDQLLDEVTREYFTNFGKKIRGESLPSATPIYSYEDTRVVTDRPRYTQVEPYYLSNDYEDERRETAAPIYRVTPRVRVHYGHQARQRPHSLDDDTRVNYKNPLPALNPDSEWIPGFDPEQKPRKPSIIPNYRQYQSQLDNQEYVRTNTPRQPLSAIIRNYDGRQRLIEPTNAPPTNFLRPGDSRQDAPRSYATTVGPSSLESDIDVNYGDQRPPINPDAEYIDPSASRETSANNNNEKASYFAYRLPGDGGHFYFLTPQAITQRRDENNGYLYPRPRRTSFSRERRRGSRNSRSTHSASFSAERQSRVMP